MRGLSLVATSGGHSSSRCAGLSLSRPFPLRSTGSRSAGSVVCGSRAQLLRSMWDLPRPGLEPVSPALAGRFSTTAPPGKPWPSFLMLANQISLLRIAYLNALLIFFFFLSCESFQFVVFYWLWILLLGYMYFQTSFKFHPYSSDLLQKKKEGNFNIIRFINPPFVISGFWPWLRQVSLPWVHRYTLIYFFQQFKVLFFTF